MLDIFICHSFADRDKANALATRLARSAEAQVWLEECGAGARESIATAWEAGLACAGIVLLLSPEAVPKRLDRQSWNALLAHVESNAQPQVATILTADCAFPRLLERRNFHKWTEKPQEVLRAMERWAIGTRQAAEAIGFAPPRLPWFQGREPELDELWARLVDDAGAVALVNRIPGSGKTSLAHEFARAAAEQFRDVIRIECGERSVNSLLGELAACLGIAAAGSGEEVIDRVDAAVREHRLLLVLDNVTGPLPIRDSGAGRASVLITARDADVLPPHHVHVLPVEGVATSAPDPPDSSDDRRLWHSMQACRTHAFPLALAARISGLTEAAASEVCARLTARRCADLSDRAPGWLRLSAQAIAAANLSASELEPLRRRHAVELATVVANWRRQPALCREFLIEAEAAFRWAASSEWDLAQRIAEGAAAYLRAEARWFDAAEWYRRLLSAAQAADDDRVTENCRWELSWLESDTGEPRRPLSSGAQLSFGF